MSRVQVLTLDEALLEKGRGPDITPRKKRGLKARLEADDKEGKKWTKPVWFGKSIIRK